MTPAVLENRAPYRFEEARDLVITLARTAVEDKRVEHLHTVLPFFSEDEQAHLFNCLVYFWKDQGCPFDVGEQIVKLEDFNTTDLDTILNDHLLGIAFRNGNFKVYKLLTQHPEAHILLNADRIVAAANYGQSVFYGQNHFQIPNFEIRMACALFDLLPEELMTEVAAHQNLYPTISDQLQVLRKIRGIWHFQQGKSSHFWISPAPLMRCLFRRDISRPHLPLDFLKKIESFL